MKLSMMSTKCQRIKSSTISKMRIVWTGVCLLSLTVLFFCWLYVTFKEQEKVLSSESYIVFKSAMLNEEKLYTGRRFSSYDPNYSPNDIPREEKSGWCVQDYLTFCNPNRSVLDSLFQVSLIEKDIEAQAAIRYINKRDTIDTSLDSLFYKTALALDPIVFRFDTNKDNNITLQAYVKFPFKTVLTRSPMLILIFCLWLISQAGIVCYYYLVIRKKKQEPATLTIPVSTVPLVTEQAIVWTELPCDLLFDEKYGDLLYKGNVCARLRDNNLRLFHCFLKTEEHKLTIEDICIEVLCRNISEGLTESDRAVVSTTIFRFRNKLKSVPVIKIETLRTTGFQMIFKETC